MNYPLNRGPNTFLPEPQPPVSANGPMRPPSTSGVDYGTQQKAIWKPGQRDARQVCDVEKTDFLWRFSCFGRVVLNITYGTKGTRSLFVQCPAILTIPGQFTATATPIDGNGADCLVTLTQASAGARSIARRYIIAPAGDVPLDDNATDYWALTPSTLTISGSNVTVPALAIVPLVVGSVLHTGSGFQEYET